MRLWNGTDHLISDLALLKNKQGRDAADTKLSGGFLRRVHVEFAHPISPGKVREVLSGLPGVMVLDDPQSNVYPTPIQASGKDDVFVGRIRQDMSHGNGIAMWIVCDNLRKGAALNAIQIAEEVLSRELLLAPGRRVKSWSR